MDINKLNKTLISFWDGQFETLKVKAIKKDDFSEPSTLFDKVKYVADQCESILDFGSGSGYTLFYAALFGEKMKKGLGVDTSKKAIAYANETKDISGLLSIEFNQGDHYFLDTIKESSFDGIICSNVLDVVPYETSCEIIEALDRVLKPGGLFLLKLNFYLTDDMIEKMKMEKIAKNTYELNGVLRGMNLITEEWASRFKNYEVLEVNEYQRLEKGPKDRLLLMKKMK
ncbi:MAG: class I SAM-dependent methyltransferase [Tenericutes bacterium]|nr:class I SAM-dependent methyltransferase [Mycoplasmatota bacterium]